MNENGKMRLVETIPTIEERRMMEEVISTMIQCKHFSKYHNVPPI
jgi:hypothetical protein